MRCILEILLDPFSITFEEGVRCDVEWSDRNSFLRRNPSKKEMRTRISNESWISNYFYETDGRMVADWRNQMVVAGGDLARTTNSLLTLVRP